MQASQANLVKALLPLLDDDAYREIIDMLVSRADTEREGTSEEKLKDLVEALLPLLNDDAYHTLVTDKLCSLEPWKHGTPQSTSLHARTHAR
jgi:hypothetical protein